MSDALSLTKRFGNRFKVTKAPEFYEDPVHLRLPPEYYDRIEAKYGFFFPYDETTIAFFCSANRIKELILRKFRRKFAGSVLGSNKRSFRRLGIAGREH